MLQVVKITCQGRKEVGVYEDGRDAGQEIRVDESEGITMKKRE